MTGKTRVLAIDDNLQMLKEFEQFLVPKYDLRVAKSASDAIAFLNKQSCEVILLDIDMPNIDGFYFLNDIRKIPSYFDVPIIIVSGNKGEEFLNKARNSSANDVLTKPITQDLLLSSIQRAMAKLQNNNT